MQKKWVIGVFIATCVIAAFVVAMSLACSIKTVNVNVLNGGYRDEATVSVAASGKSIRGKSIFFLNEDKFAAQVEADFARRHPDATIGLEVVSIERVFPATVNVHAVTKYAHAYIAAADGYVVVDNDLRVLGTESAPRPDLIEIVATPGITVRSHTVGEIVELSDRNAVGIADELFYAIAACGYGDTFNCIAAFERIRIDLNAADGTVTLYTRADGGNGSEIVLEGTDLLQEKVRHGISAYVQDETKRTGCRIRVYTYEGKPRISVGQLS